MNIVIISLNPSSGYSGGRYHSWVMAEALVAGGHDVVYWTNNQPVFVDDFNDYPFHDKIILHKDRRFSNPPNFFKAQIVIIIPHLGRPQKLFFVAIKYSIESKAKIILQNFETPN